MSDLPLTSDDHAPIPGSLRALAAAVCALAVEARPMLLGGALSQTGIARLADGRQAALLCGHEPDWRKRLTATLTAAGRPLSVGLAGGVHLLDPAGDDMDPEVAVVAYPSTPALRVLVIGPPGTRGSLLAHAPADGPLGEWQEVAVVPDDPLIALVERTMAQELPMKRPLSQRMRQAMFALGRLEAQPRGRRTTPAVIAAEVARVEGSFERIEAGGRGRGRGGGHRVMSDAQRFITPLRMLERRQLVARVRDGEFILTDHGEEWVEKRLAEITDAVVLQTVRDLIARERGAPTRHEVARELDASVERVGAQLLGLAKRGVLRIRRRSTPDYIHRTWEPREPGPAT